MWFSLTINGILCAYFRLTAPSTPSVDATALHPPSIARRTMLAGSKYSGLAAKLAPAECSIPWSTGRMLTCPVPASRPWFRMALKFRRVGGVRSDWLTTRSTKSPPGRWSMALSNPSAW